MPCVFAPKQSGLLTLVFAVLLLGAPAMVQGVEEAVSPHAKLSMGLGVDRSARTIVGAQNIFPPSVRKVYCLVHVQDAAAPLEVTCVWYYKGKTMARVALAVGSSDFRTWSSKNILPSWLGFWEVKVLDPKGVVLGGTSFRIASGDSLAE